MKRSGFTMIELIFVIVILGILAAVALPKFIGVSEQAQAGKCQALTGTLNRTVGPALWSNSIMSGDGGVTLTTYTNAAGLADAIEAQIEIPEECGGDADEFVKPAGSLTIGAKTYGIAFADGNATSAPSWTWTVN